MVDCYRSKRHQAQYTRYMAAGRTSRAASRSVVIEVVLVSELYLHEFWMVLDYLD